jgi:hypothetical protein
MGDNSGAANEGGEVGRTIRARFVNGRLETASPSDLAAGEEVTVTILDFPGREDPERSRRSAGAWKGTIGAEELIHDIYADRLLSTRPEPRL